MDPSELSDDELLRALTFNDAQVSGSAGRASPEQTDADRQAEMQRLSDGLSQASKAKRLPPQDETTDYRYEPDRPQFDASLLYRKPGKAADKAPDASGKTPQDFKTEDIKKLLGEMDQAQANDKRGNHHARAQAFALRAGQAVSHGVGGVDAQDIPIPDKYNETKGVEAKSNQYDKLLSGEEKRQNPESEREMRQLLKDMDVTSKEKVALAERERKIKEDEDRLQRDKDKVNQTEGGKLQRAKITAAAVLGGKALGISAQAGQGNAKADAEYAGRQAERQVAGWDDVGPHSATDETAGAHLASSEAAIQAIGRKASQVMRKNGPNFPQSTEWKKLESTMMSINQEFTKAHANGVMNFKDKENNDVEIGDPQKFVQYAMQNGPDVLDNALDNMATTTDAKMGALKYRRNTKWTPKLPSDYIKDSSGGGSAKAGIDPNVLGGLADWAISGGKGNPPRFNEPNKDVGGMIPQGQRQPSKVKPQGVGRIDANGKFVVE